MNAQSLILTHPRGVSPIWCWASDGQFALCGAYSVSLFSWVCSSMVFVVHLACLVHMTIQRGVPSVGQWGKSILVEDLWMSSAGSIQGRKGCPQQCDAILCMVPPYTSPHFPLPPVSIGLAKTKSPGSSEMALAFLSWCHFLSSPPLIWIATWTYLKVSHHHSHNLVT